MKPVKNTNTNLLILDKVWYLISMRHGGMSMKLSVVKVGLPAVSTFICPENRISLFIKKMVN